MTSDNAPAGGGIPPRYAFAVPRRVRWGVAEVGIAIGALVLSIVVGSIIAGTGVIRNASALSFWVGVAGYVLIVLVVVYASFVKGQRSLTKDFRLAFRPIDLAIGLGVGLLARGVSLLFVVLVVGVTGHNPARGNLTLSSSTLWVVLTGFVLTVVIAPFVEELLCRGLILQSVRNIVLRWRAREQPAEPAQQRRAMWVSVVVSALVFGLLHSGQSTDAVFIVVLGFTTVMLGFVNALLVYATNRLGAGIIAHATFNASAVVLALLAR